MLGAGVILLPLMVTSRVRPAGVEDELEALDGVELEDDELEDDEEEDDVLLEASSAPLVPHAVRTATKASPTAYEVVPAHVILVTMPSLKGEF